MFEIGDTKVGDKHPAFIIAEAGSNHNGDLETAKELIDAAADAGVDAVKFQTFKADKLYTDDREYNDSAYEVVSDLEMPEEWIPELHNYCRSKGVYFMSTPFDVESVDLLEEYVPAFKIASFSLSHYPLLKKVAEQGKPIIVSTGAHGSQEISGAVDYLEDLGVSDLGVLHCVAAYPTPLEEINVNSVAALKEHHSSVVGLSDHSTDPGTAPAAAVALGASIIEKHFTLDKDMEGPDHSFALDPDELEELVASVRKTEKVLGDREIKVSEVESRTVDRATRKIFATKNIEKGEEITENAIRPLRPGEKDVEGLHPKYYSELIGKKAEKEIEEGSALKEEDVEIEL
jgi:N,N'-diacetyllegionaminate synthase